MKISQFIVIASFLCTLAAPALALDYTRYLDDVTQLNRIKPLQNPSFESIDKILKRRVLDRKNKVIGDIRDILVKANGSITHLEVEFNRLGYDSDVFINYRDMSVRPGDGSYTVNFSDDQIAELYPTLLSGIEAAAGSDDDIFSVNKVLGSEVKAEDGRLVGIVDDILFSGNGSRVEALYIGLRGFNMRGKSVAVPLSMARIATADGRKQVTVGNEQADAILNYADNHR